MKKLSLNFVLLILSFMTCIAQNNGINNLWLTGYASWAGGNFGNRQLDFYSGSLTITPDSFDLGLFEANTVLTDTSGNLLFYTNGYDIADSTNQIMLNGDTISPTGYRALQPSGTGLPIPQAVFAIGVPNSSNLYYLFHNTFDNAPNYNTAMHLYYSIIDMNGNGGKGAVIAKNVILLNDSLDAGHITGCKHGNGRDWWITCLRLNSNLIYTFLVSPYGISGPYMQNIGSIKTRIFGASKFSPDGTKFAYFKADYNNPGSLDIYDFDRCSGIFSNPLSIDVSQSIGVGGGCEFSPNSNLMYVSNIDSVYQYNLLSANVDSSKTIVAIWDSFYSPYPPYGTYFNNCQLAPDGKIYIGTGNSTKHFHVINHPDSVGVDCHLIQHGIALPYFHSSSLPNHPNYFLGRDTGSVCDTVTWWMGEQNHPPPKTDLKVLSNPNDGHFTLWFRVHDKPGWVTVYDVNVNVVFKEGVAQWSQYKQVDIRNKASGVYFVRMVWGAEEQSAKVIKE